MGPRMTPIRSAISQSAPTQRATATTHLEGRVGHVREALHVQQHGHVEPPCACRVDHVGRHGAGAVQLVRLELEVQRRLRATAATADLVADALRRELVEKRRPAGLAPVDGRNG
jgi:hypothetical protein